MGASGNRRDPNRSCPWAGTVSVQILSVVGHQGCEPSSISWISGAFPSHRINQSLDTVTWNKFQKPPAIKNLLCYSSDSCLLANAWDCPNKQLTQPSKSPAHPVCVVLKLTTSFWKHNYTVKRTDRGNQTDRPERVPEELLPSLMVLDQGTRQRERHLGSCWPCLSGAPSCWGHLPCRDLLGNSSGR